MKNKPNVSVALRTNLVPFTPSTTVSFSLVNRIGLGLTHGERKFEIFPQKSFTDVPADVRGEVVNELSIQVNWCKSC